MQLSRILLPLLALSLAACDDNGSNGPITKDVAVIATRTPTFDAGAVSLVDVEAPFAALNNQAGTISDIFVRSGGDHYFVVERFRGDRIKRYEVTNPATPTFTYSTQDAGDTASSNPSDLLIVSATKAYLLRYGSAKLWIVNPSATSEANFKTGEIDLSAYDADGVPEMTAGVIKDGKLYVVLQRLEFFAAVRNGYVAVIDTASDQEVDTNPAADGLKGIEVPVRNPGSLVATPGSNKLVLIAAGGFDENFDPAYDGGIVSIDTSSNAATLLLDDGDAATHPYGQFSDLAVASASRGYFVGSAGFFAGQTLYRFNPGSGSTLPVAVSGFGDVKLGALAVDPTGRLWVGRNEDAAPGISILDVAGSSESLVKDLVGTQLVPINIDFVTAPLNTP